MALDITTARLDVAKLYIAAFDRAPDVDGLNFWVNAYVSGKDTLSTMAQKFTNSTEYQGKYPSYLADAEYVEKIYVNVFDRGSDADGKAFWVNALTTGALTRGTLMKSMVDAATKNGGTDNANLTAQAQAGVDAAISAANTYTLTSGNDNLTGMIFEAPQTYTPGGTDRINSLQDNDKLTGTSTVDVLNVTIGLNADTTDATITPVLTGVETINAKFDATGYALDLQDSTGVTAVNVLRMEAAATNRFNNMNAVANMSIANSSTTATEVGFDFSDTAVVGTADTATLGLSNALVTSVFISNAIGAVGTSGIENLTVASNGTTNNIGTLNATSVRQMTINGAGNLTVGIIDNSQTDGTFTTIDGSAATGNLNLTIDAGLNADMEDVTGTGAAVNFVLKTGTGNDTLNIGIATAGDVADTIDLGTGTDTVAYSNVATTVFSTTLATTTIAGAEAVTITRADDAAGAADTLTVDMAKLSGDQTIRLTNLEGDGSDAIFTLNNLSAVEAGQITLVHSATGSNAVADNQVVANLQTATGSTDTVVLTIVDGINDNVRFNATLTAGGTTAATIVENVTITDSDTEDNSIALASFATNTGTITLTGGLAGKFMNLDSTANGLGKVQTGATGDATTATAALLVANPAITAAGLVQPARTDSAVTSAYSTSSATVGEKLVASSIVSTGYNGDVIVRVGTANQTITLGNGTNTVVFADTAGVTATSAGLTIADTITGGTATDTIIIDGTGAQTLGASEWTNLNKVDVVRLSGAAGSTYNLTVTDRLVDQSDNGSVIQIVNNDGSLVGVAENAATIDLRLLSATNFVNFVGGNGDGAAAQAGKTVQTIIVNDTTANGGHVLNGGDKDTVTNYASIGAAAAGFQFATQAASDAAYAAAVTTPGLAAAVDGNENIYRIYNAAQVTVGDLANTSNFSTISYVNDVASSQTLVLTLDDTTVDRLVDASHASSTTQVERLYITATDNALVAGANAVLNISASALTAKSALTITAGAGADTIVAGAGADVITGGLGYDIITGGTGNDTFIYTNATATAITTDGAAAAGTYVSATAAGTAAIAAGDIFTGMEVINDIAVGDIISFGNTNSAVDGGTANMIEDNEFVIVQGVYNAVTGAFTVGVGLTAGADSMIFFDADSTAGINWQAIALVGVTNAEVLAATYAAGADTLTF